MAMSYYAVPKWDQTEKLPQRINGVFEIFQLVAGKSTRLFELSNRGERFNELLKRGISEADARTLFYEMDE